MPGYVGDFLLGVTIEDLFNSNDAPGAPIVLAGSPAVTVYESGNAAQFTTGSSITASYDSVTGMNRVVIDTSSGYSAGKDYWVVLTAGTVDAVDQTGMVVVHFSIQNRYQGVDVKKWDGTTIPGVDTAGYPRVTIKDGTGTGEINTASGKVPATIAAGDLATDSITATSLTTDAATKIFNSLTAGHTTVGGVGKLLADNVDATVSSRATAAELAKVPKSDSNVTWNATALGSIQSEATDALNAYDPPTNAEMEARTLPTASYFDPAADTVANVTTVGSVTTKTGYSLAATGLDSISTTAPAGVASNFREMLVQVWRRFFKRTTKDSDEIKTYADNGTSVLTTQTYTSAGDDDDVGAAS